MTGIVWVADSNADEAFTKKRKRQVGKRKVEFLDWGSRPLIEFLQAIDKYVVGTKPTQREVAALIIRYITDNNLFSPAKKKKVLCDQKLFDLFGKRTIARPKVYDLLEEHFAENHNSSDDDSMDSSDEENRRGKKNKKDMQKKIPQTPKSCFASIVSDNIKLVYLRKSLLQEFLKVPESFTSKVVGSFVRMKTDPNDIYQKNRFQLQLVTGAEMISEAGREVHLRVANYFKNVPITMLSDEMFTDEEIEDVRDRIKAGVLKRLTVVELEFKAQLLHTDITKHSIAKELALLQGRIDHANEKGWRRELFEYLERRKLLQTPSEVEKLLLKIPEVIAEELEPDAAMEASPRSILRGTSDISSTDASGCGDLATPSQLVADDLHTPRGPTEDMPGDDHLVKKPKGCEDVNEVLGDLLKSPAVTSKLEERMGPGDTSEISMADWLKPPIYASKQVVEIEDEPVISIRQGELFTNEINKQSKLGDCSADMLLQPVMAREEVPIMQLAYSGEKPKQPVHPHVFIDLSSDDEPEFAEPMTRDKVNGECPDSCVWHYFAPNGTMQGPFSLSLMKQWHDSNYFGPEFTIWKTGQSPEDAVLLTDVLSRILPS